MPAEVEVPRWKHHASRADALEALQFDLAGWISSEALATLGEAWEPEGRPDATDVPLLFDWYDSLSAKHWDFRRGAERNLATTADLSPDLEQRVYEAATALGLRTARPPSGRKYDATLILGGLVRACIIRPRYAAQLAENGLELGEVISLGGFRNLAGDELELARSLDVAADDEFGAMCEGVARAFKLRDPTIADGSAEHVTGNHRWRVASFDDARNISVIAAPSSEPHIRRANSVDTYEWWAQRSGSLLGRRILLITTGIYVPYQGSGAIRTLALRHGAEVETIGVPDELTQLGPLTQEFRASHYLQELRSAIRGYHDLHSEVTSELQATIE
ncbi:MAG: hypothetical protein WBA45_01925 [Microthrixaceae bacterium]